MESWEWRILRTGKRGEYRMVERRWILEYMNRKCLNAVLRIAHKRLGPTPTTGFPPGVPEPVRRSYLPFADLVCVFPDRIEIMEFKVHDPVKAVAQLQLYRTLAQQDPELTRFKELPIILKLVHWKHDANLEALCKANGIVLEIECPAFLVEILRQYGYRYEECLKNLVK